MITQEKLAIYQKYGGDHDRFVRMGRPRERAAIQDADWIAIDELLHLLHCLKSEALSDEFADRIRQKLYEETADENVRNTLLALA